MVGRYAQRIKTPNFLETSEKKRKSNFWPEKSSLYYVSKTCHTFVLPVTLPRDPRSTPKDKHNSQV